MPRCLAYQALRALGSRARRKIPPMPVTRAMNASIDWSEYIGDFLSSACIFIDFGGFREVVRFAIAELTYFIFLLQCTSLLVHYLSVKRDRKVEAAAFAFRLDEHSGVPVYRQLIDQVQ